MGTLMSSVQLVEANDRWGNEAVKILLEHRERVEEEDFNRAVILRVLANRQKILDGMQSAIEGPWASHADIIDRAVAAVGSHQIHQGVKATLSAAIVGTWTAFENLAGDLWVAAVNERPRSLACMAGRSGQRERKKIPYDTLAKHKFNVENKMGTIYFETGAVAFTTLKAIESSYENAFADGFQDIDNTVKDRSFFVLSSVRNVLVHKAGHVDSEFKNSMKNEPRFSDLKLGDELPIDGDMAAQLIDPVVRATVKFIEAVDAWMQLHPEECGDS